MLEKAIEPPSGRDYAKESRAIFDMLRMPFSLASSRILKDQSNDKRAPVVLLPGFGGGDRIMAPFRQFLSNSGFDCYGWGLGTNYAGLNLDYDEQDISWDFDQAKQNNGELGVPYLCDQMVERVLDIYHDTSMPVILVGWSLGGCIAREVARDAPQAVKCVVTLGTPVRGGPKYTAAGQQLAKRGLDLDWIEREVEKRAVRPINCPITAIISKTDGVVAYESTIDYSNQQVEHVDINTAHLGMVFNPSCWRATLSAINHA